MVEDGGKLRGGEVVGSDVDIRGDRLGYGVGHFIALEVSMSLNPSEDDGEIDALEKVRSKKYQEQNELLLVLKGKVEEDWRRLRLEQVVRSSMVPLSLWVKYP